MADGLMAYVEPGVTEQIARQWLVGLRIDERMVIAIEAESLLTRNAFDDMPIEEYKTRRILALTGRVKERPHENLV